jgi:hypothetical protein
MALENQNAIHNAFPNDLKIAKEFAYDKCRLTFSKPKLNSESIDYGACTFELGKHQILYRVAKITPKKAGLFVTIWKRNVAGITEPFDISDDVDFVIVSARSGQRMGQFIFPKSILASKGVITNDKKKGKCGIRVYPPWDRVVNKQAEKTQCWQVQYFLEIGDGNSTDLKLLKMLLSVTTEIEP